jgi:UTP--glucose-1-phosphate uridylyltransferase
MRGTGQALLLAKPFVGNDPFVVAYPDDIVFSDIPLSRQLIDAHQASGNAVLAVQDLVGRDVSRYGVVEPAGEGNPVPMRRLVEKPPRGSEPSTLVSYGRYLFTPDLLPHLEQGWQNHEKGEFYHVDALNQLAAEGNVSALSFQGLRLDTGAPLGYLEAICRYALRRKDLAEPARTLFRELSQTP